MTKNAEQKKENNKNKDKQEDVGVEKEKKTVSIPEEEYNSLKEKEKKAQENYERLLRLQAEFDNARKRWEREKTEYIKFAHEEVISQLIPFVDDFQRALEAADKTKDFDILHKGVEMISKHLLELLKEKGVVAIEALGKPFNPAYHEALMQVESNEHPEHTVIEELQKGYLLNNRVLRTAKVKVTKSAKEQSKAENTEQRDKGNSEDKKQ